MFYSQQQDIVIYVGSGVGDQQIEYTLGVDELWGLVLGPQVHDAASIGKYTAQVPSQAVAPTKCLIMRDPYERVFRAYREYCEANGVVAWATWFGSADYTGPYLDPLTSQFPAYDSILQIESPDMQFNTNGIWPPIRTAYIENVSAMVLPVNAIPDGDKPAIGARYAADFAVGGYPA